MSKRFYDQSGCEEPLFDITEDGKYSIPDRYGSPTETVGDSVEPATDDASDSVEPMTEGTDGEPNAEKQECYPVPFIVASEIEKKVDERAADERDRNPYAQHEESIAQALGQLGVNRSDYEDAMARSLMLRALDFVGVTEDDIKDMGRDPYAVMARISAFFREVNGGTVSIYSPEEVRRRVIGDWPPKKASNPFTEYARRRDDQTS